MKMLAGYCPYSACIDRRHIALYGELIDRIGILVENKLEEYKLSGSVNLIKSNELGRGEGLKPVIFLSPGQAMTL